MTWHVKAKLNDIVIFSCFSRPESNLQPSLSQNAQHHNRSTTMSMHTKLNICAITKQATFPH